MPEDEISLLPSLLRDSENEEVERASVVSDFGPNQDHDTCPDT